MNPIFQSIYQHFLLTEEDLEKIAEKHKKIQVSKGEFLLKEGEVTNHYYLIESGLVRAFVYDFNNEAITTEFFSENEVAIIPASLFRRSPSKENLQALTDCEMWEIGFDDFQELFHSIPGLAEWGRLWFTYQLFSLKQRQLDMVSETATNRYLKLMKEKPQVIQRAPLKQIASYLGITDTSLSRIRKDILKA